MLKRVLDIVVAHGLVLHSQAIKVTLPAQLVFLTSYNIQIKREQMNEHVNQISFPQPR